MDINDFEVYRDSKVLVQACLIGQIGARLDFSTILIFSDMSRSGRLRYERLIQLSDAFFK
ncbi:MAG: hypothetical protein ACJA2S_003313 [Cyclobacteriaceae bacterium]